MSNKNLDSESYLKKRNLFLTLLIVTGACNGLLSTILAEQANVLTIVEISCNLIAISLVYLWISYDAKARDFRIPKLIGYLIILIGIIGVPLYFWRSRTTKEFWFNVGGLWLFILYSMAYGIVNSIVTSVLKYS